MVFLSFAQIRSFSINGCPPLPVC
uniref:Tropinone reductase-like 3 n=1 Tax=Rhizophora mucronata TaxID=61149 RepID=A0A2P2JG83_RHIMU